MSFNIPCWGNLANFDGQVCLINFWFVKSHLKSGFDRPQIQPCWDSSSTMVTSSFLWLVLTLIFISSGSHTLSISFSVWRRFFLAKQSRHFPMLVYPAWWFPLMISGNNHFMYMYVYKNIYYTPYISRHFLFYRMGIPAYFHRFFWGNYPISSNVWSC